MQRTSNSRLRSKAKKYDAEANRYLNLIKYSDDSLKQLTSYFEKCKEPTIILFLGDHQPRLTDEFMNKITNGKYQTWSAEQMMKRYQVPFVIWANYDIKEQRHREDKYELYAKYPDPDSWRKDDRISEIFK